MYTHDAPLETIPTNTALVGARRIASSRPRRRTTAAVLTLLPWNRWPFGLSTPTPVWLSPQPSSPRLAFYSDALCTIAFARRSRSAGWSAGWPTRLCRGGVL